MVVVFGEVQRFHMEDKDREYLGGGGGVGKKGSLRGKVVLINSANAWACPLQALKRNSSC